VFRHWAQVRSRASRPAPGTHRVGDSFPLAAVVGLGGLAPDDVSVEAYFGRLDEKQQIAAGRSVALRLEASLDRAGTLRRRGALRPQRMQGYTVRVRRRTPTRTTSWPPA